MSEIAAAIAVTRFGMGARPGEIKAASSDPRGWLTSQIIQNDVVRASSPSLLTAQDAAAGMAMDMAERRQQRRSGMDSIELRAAAKTKRRARRTQFQLEMQDRHAHAVQSTASFAERWVRFWSNHFTVSARKMAMIPLVGPYEREAIRPHIFTSFGQLLHAAAFHQAMLVYLDNHKSTGPNSQAARRKNIGLNENLGREILELHTLGATGGYIQADVEALAKALTGWTVSNRQNQRHLLGQVVFEAALHEPGPQYILGKRYAADGKSQAKAVLDDLAVHPSTARHIAVKLARHFIADAPPEQAVAKLENVFLETQGDLKKLANAVVNLDTAWEPVQRKLKTPSELFISAGRSLGYQLPTGRDARKIYQSFGQPPFLAQAPNGWSDLAESWSGPDAIKKRLEWANQVAQNTPSHITANSFLNEALGALMSDRNRSSISRAESHSQALVLALMTPEFQRR